MRKGSQELVGTRRAQPAIMHRSGKTRVAAGFRRPAPNRRRAG